MRKMATQVEVGAVLPSLASLSELTNEAKLQHAFASPLSDAGGQPGELLEEGAPFGNALRAATMTPATVKPRLTPKPFCREKSADTFAIVKPPVPVLKPSTTAPKPSVFAKASEDMSIARGLTGNVPPLVNQTLVESKASGDFVANMPFYSSPQANTVILFETGSTDRVRMTLTPDRNVVGVPRTLSILSSQEGKLLPSKSEGSYRRPEGAVIHRQLSLSSESRPGPWNPCRPLERADTPQEKTKEEQKQLRSRVSLASEGQARLKQRPVSAIFLESLKDPKHCTPDVSEEKPLLEKPWVRKPRPLSMDLTAKFENRDLSVQRKSGPFEVKEKNLAAHVVDVGCSRHSETGPKSEAAGLGREDLSKSDLKAADRLADSPGVQSVTDPQIQKPSPNEASSICHSSPKDLGQFSAKDRKYLWELKLRSLDEQTESEVDVLAASEKSQEYRSSKGQFTKDKTTLDQKDVCTVSENCARATGMESRSSRGGDVKKVLNLPDTSANGAALENTKPFTTSPEKESRILNIQQRIKELTAENADTKPGNLRRSFRSRPLSSDLTKLFSSLATSSEVRPERPAEPNRKPLNETQGVPENDVSPLCGPGCSEVPGPPRKPQQLIKTPRVDWHLEKDGRTARERQNMVPQGEGPPTQADPGLNPPSVAVTENPCLKTVRATMFEHSVQRHNVAVDRLGTEPVAQPMSELAGGQVGHDHGPWLEKALEGQTSVKKVSIKQADASLNAVKHGQATSLKEGPATATWEKYTAKEKLEKPTAKHIEDSLKYQRIEPRYEVLQTVGERAQSEAVAAVLEDKAMMLRSRRSLKERRRTEEGIAAAVSRPCSLDLKECGWRKDGSVSKMKDPGEAAVKASSAKGCNVSHGQQVSHKQISELNNNQTRQEQPTTRAPCFLSRNKDLGTADDAVSSLSSGTEKERPDICFSDKLQCSRILKSFPENYGAGPGRADGYEARAHDSENMASTRAGEHGSPSFPGGTSQWQKCSSSSSKASPPSGDTKMFEQRDSRLRKTTSAYSAKEELGVSGHLVAGERFGQLDVEEGIRRSSRGVSAPKATERWRRKTLPHGAVQFEDAGTLAAESAKALGRRDSLQLHNSSIAKRNRESKCEADPREGSPASPGRPVDSLRQQQLSPSKPRVTSSATPAQEPGGNENACDPLQSKPVSSAVENLLLSPNAGTSRRPHRQHNRRFPDTLGSLDRHRSKSWGEGGPSYLPRPGDARCENWRSLRQHLGDAQEEGAHVAPLFQAEPKSPSYMRHFPQDRLGPQTSGSCSWDIAKGKGTDGYRSRVLDIDALMAEYKDDPRREGGPSEERGELTHRRNSADKASGSYNSNSPKGFDHSPRSTGQGIRAAEFCWPEHVYTSEQEKTESYSQEWSPLKAHEVALSTPPWGRLVAEKLKYLPADSTSIRTKTFIVDEEHGESLVLRHQRAKCASGNTQHASPIHVDKEPGAGLAPCPSQGLSEAVSWKGTSPAQQAGVACSEDYCKTIHASGTSRGKGAADINFPMADVSRVETRAEWNSSESGLANAPHDLKRSYSEKARQARVRGSLPLGPDVREGVHQSSLPERVNGWLSKRGTFQQDSSIQEGRKDLGKEPPKQGHGGSGIRSPPYLPAQRRSHSFYKERRTDHWTVSRRERRQSHEPSRAGIPQPLCQQECKPVFPPLRPREMDYLGDKLTVAQTHMTHWVGSVRRSLQEALNLVTTAVAHERTAGDGAGRAPFKRTSSFRHFASRSRESFRRFSVRSQQRLSSLRKRQASSEQPDLDQLKECFGRPATEAKDTDTLVQEADSQYGTWSDQRHSGDSLVPESPSSESNVVSAWKQPPGSRPSSFSSQTDPASVADQHDSSRDQRSTSLDRSSTDVDSADGTEGSAPADTCLDFSFLDHTPVLDSSALKTRVQLSKRRRQRRAPISHSLRRSTGADTDHRLFTTEEVDNASLFQDCTEAKSAKKDGSEEEKTHPVEKLPGSQPQRLPVFPGMDHSVLKAQLRKRQEMEGSRDGSPVQLSKSPKSPFQARTLGGRVLPAGVEQEERPEEPSPQWLRELKSKKRQSQYENQV